MTKAVLGLHIFRRDLRVEDNTSLSYALSVCDKVIACFILDPKQFKDNKYKSDNALQFMFNSLVELDDSLRKRGSRLYLFMGDYSEILRKIITDYNVNIVSVNRDYTPYSINRDHNISQICNELKCQFKSFADCLLTEPEMVKKTDNLPYTIFTPFYNKAKDIQIRNPISNNYSNYYEKFIEGEIDIKTIFKYLEVFNKDIALNGGRKEALNLLGNIENMSSYDIDRNIPYKNITTKLSAHHKFGTISIRETYSTIKREFGSDFSLIRELYWRDFFTHIAYHFPHIFNRSFKEKYSNIKWSEDKENFNQWCNGETGYPIVDAGMKELNQTGFMHGRVRMITASFLVKDLHIDWRMGERYFASQLVDYDPSVNNGNWQWCSSTGCDSTPYFRIFNPFSQQKRFDEDCLYIKKWIPTLQSYTAQEIHSFENGKKNLPTYRSLLVDHKESSSLFKLLFKSF